MTSDSDSVGARIEALPDGARRDLLRILISPSDVRSDVIRQFHERSDGASMAEVLIDLEAEEMLRLRVIDVLQRSLEVSPD